MGLPLSMRISPYGEFFEEVIRYNVIVGGGHQDRMRCDPIYS